MKLRIKGNSIRLRLLRGEVAQLLQKGFLSEETQFSRLPADNFYYGVILSDEADKVEAKFERGRIMIVLPRTTAESWAVGDDLGIEARPNGLEILVEKDLVCHGRPGDPDNADAFGAEARP